jgi:hypothetical protein
MLAVDISTGIFSPASLRLFEEILTATCAFAGGGGLMLIPILCRKKEPALFSYAIAG